jgi:hypothetical protein
MSYIDWNRLKSANDTQIPFSTLKIPFTTSQVRIDTQYQYGMLCKALRIVNNDNVNSITFRTISPNNPLDVVEPATEATSQSWTSYVEINPDPVTGNGLVELELVDPRYAYF